MWELKNKESWAPNNWCFWTVVLEKTLVSLLDFMEIKLVNPKRKSVVNILWKDWWWGWNSTNLGTWFEELIHWKRPWCWERLKAGGEEDDRGWDGWMASQTRYTWIWASSGSWQCTGKTRMLHSMGSERVRLSILTELNHDPLCNAAKETQRKQQTFGTTWGNSIEMYITICIIYDQYKFDAWSGALKTGPLGPPITIL